MEKLNSCLRQDVAKLRGTVKSLDIEKDNLQQQVDEKTERVMALDARRVKQVRFVHFVFVQMPLNKCFAFIRIMYCFPLRINQRLN
jgi:hypothetical protein